LFFKKSLFSLFYYKNLVYIFVDRKGEDSRLSRKENIPLDSICIDDSFTMKN
jgi:hypothetical protein